MGILFRLRTRTKVTESGDLIYENSMNLEKIQFWESSKYSRRLLARILELLGLGGLTPFGVKKSLKFEHYLKYFSMSSEGSSYWEILGIYEKMNFKKTARLTIELSKGGHKNNDFILAVYHGRYLLIKR